MNNEKDMIDGVRVFYTGEKIKVKDLDGKEMIRERIEMYDRNGNKFYSNYGSKEEAIKAIERLAEKGITAVLGPKAPMRSYRTGIVMPNPMNGIGVYIVDTKDKEKLANLKI